MFHRSEKKEVCYNVELLNSEGATVKEWQIRGEYEYDDNMFMATTTANKNLDIVLSERHTLVIREI